jgi:hypothetical protein
MMGVQIMRFIKRLIDQERSQRSAVTRRGNVKRRQRDMCDRLRREMGLPPAPWPDGGRAS